MKRYIMDSNLIWDTIKWVVPIVCTLATIRIYQKANALARKSQTDESIRTRQQFNAELRQWADSCIHVLSDLEIIAESGATNQLETQPSLSKISALVDAGRLFFPNPDTDLYGKHKEGAFQGFRPRILDWLVFTYKLIKTAPSLPDQETARMINYMRRGFTSDVQVVINPRNLFMTMEELQELLSQSDGSFMDTSLTHQKLVLVQNMIFQRDENMADWVDQNPNLP